jgi:hypothetical protein
MDDAERLRNRATRLFALAIRAREEGHMDYAAELTDLASEALAQAEEMERRIPPAPESAQHVAQQQQQIQPKADDPEKK